MTTHNTEQRVNNKLFGWLRRKASEYRKDWLAENGHPKGMLGKKHTAEKKAQIAASSKAAMIADRGVPVHTYNLDGTFCKSYITLTECADDLQTNPSNVKYTADGDFGHCKGKQIRYELCEQIDPYVRVKVKTYIRTDEHKRYIGEKTRNNKAICNHCGMETTKTNINRWHNDNCKHKKDTI